MATASRTNPNTNRMQASRAMAYIGIALFVFVNPSVCSAIDVVNTQKRLGVSFSLIGRR